jgi:sulfur-oxidizing protein SoxA
MVGMLLSSMAFAQNDTEKAIEKYRQMLKEDPWSNPGLLDADRGEALWGTARGPKNVSLEQCDLGKGPGNVEGAFAELPRYFADAERVMDVETRILWCMEKLQGFDHASLVRQPHPGVGQPVKELGAIATFVASKSAGMKFSAKLDQPKEREAVALGGPLQPAFGSLRFWMYDVPRRNGQTDQAARITLPVQSRRGPQGRRRMAGLSGLNYSCHDHAASPL